MNQEVCLVAIEKTTLSFDKLYSYAIPQNLKNKIFPGSRVLIPFSKNNLPRIGIVFEIKEGEHSGLKSVISVMDSYPLFSEELLSVAKLLKEQIFCTYNDILKAMLPTGLNLKAVKEYIPLNKEADNLSENEKEVFKFILKKKKAKAISIAAAFPNLDTDEIISSLLEKQYLSENNFYKRLVGDATTKMVRLISTDGKLTEKQEKVLELLIENGDMSLKETMYYAAVGKVVLENLQKNGFVEIYEKEDFRDPYSASFENENLSDIALTDEQQEVFGSLLSKLKEGKFNKSLLFGITGSGKTQVYLKLIENALTSNKTALILVPEISLTPQTVRKMKALFGEKVAVLHSGLTLAGRLDEWKRIKEKKANVVVGTRSAVFAPLENIGLIVIDEAHESTYTSDSNPRYNAISVATMRGKLNNALLLLASATPSVEMYHESCKSESLYTLKKRYSDAVLPEVFVVDMKREKNRRGKIISEVLAEELCYNLENKKQSILLLNRRGYNTSLTCMNCGYSVECPTCSVPMTYHKANGHLMCHYCGKALEVPSKCPVCDSEYIKYDGAGTQSLEEELKELFPDARVLRMDLDTTMRSMSHEKYLSDFGEGKYDILVGTQMIAKGLDFPNVTLVGVLSADSLLASTDWKNSERAFSLLTQVVGRSGRGTTKGRAFIQTFDTDNFILKYAAEQNYEAFYENEIRNRKIMLYPPFCDIWSVGFSGENEAKTNAASNYFLSLMKEIANTYEKLPLRVLGPITPPIAKLSGKYRRKITIKCRSSDKMTAFFKEVLLKFYEKKEFSDVSLYVDTNGDR